MFEHSPWDRPAVKNDPTIRELQTQFRAAIDEFGRVADQDAPDSDKLPRVQSVGEDLVRIGNQLLAQLTHLGAAFNTFPLLEVDTLVLTQPTQDGSYNDIIGDQLDIVLCNSGLTDECENPDMAGPWQLTNTRGERVGDAYARCNGGDAFKPAVCFLVNLPITTTDGLGMYQRWVNIPPADDQTMLCDAMYGGGTVDPQSQSSDLLTRYLKQTINDRHHWHLLDDAVADTRLAGTARSILDEDDEE